MTAQSQEILGYECFGDGGVYTPVTGGVLLNTTPVENETSSNGIYYADGTGIGFSDGFMAEDVTGFPLGFTVNFGGAECTHFVVSPAGYVQFGQSTITVRPSANDYALSYDGMTNLIANLSATGYYLYPETEISYVTTPDELVVQYKNIGISYAFWGESWPVYDFQIRVKSNGELAIVYNNAANLEDNRANLRIGLRGPDASLLPVATDGTVMDAYADQGSNNAGYVGITSEVPNGYTLSFYPPEDCVAPVVAQTLPVTASATSDELSFEFEPSDAFQQYVILLSKGEPTEAPVDKTVYSKGDELGNATVFYVGNECQFEAEDYWDLEDLDPATTYYVTVYAANAFCANGPLYGAIPYAKGSATTLPGAPASISVEAVSTTTAKLSVEANESGDNVIVVYTNEVYHDPFNYGDYPLVGELSGEYAVGDEVEGGGTVAYVGASVKDFVVENLEASTGYYFLAYSYDADNQYSTTKIEASTATYIEAPLSFGFENVIKYDMPAGWTADSDKLLAQQLRVVNAAANIKGDSEWQLAFQFANVNQDGYAWVSPQPINVTEDGTFVSFTFAGYESESRFASGPINFDHTVISLQASVDGENYEDIAVFDAASHPDMTYNTAERPVANFVTISGDLSDYIGQTVNVRFRYEYTGASILYTLYMYFDNFSVDVLDEVPVVQSAVTTFNTAEIAWLSRYNDNELAYAVVGEDTELVYETVVVEGKSYTLENLTPETSYQVKVRGIVADGEYTEWSEPFSFTTPELPECEAPTDLVVTIDETSYDGSVLLSWTGSDEQLSWEVHYRASSATEWTVISDIEECQVVVTGLADNTQYIWSVRAYATYDRVSPWATQERFTTPTATGVNDVMVNGSEATYYDLSGNKVSNPVKGLYIVKEGEKVTKKVIR